MQSSYSTMLIFLNSVTLFPWLLNFYTHFLLSYLPLFYVFISLTIWNILKLHRLTPNSFILSEPMFQLLVLLRTFPSTVFPMCLDVRLLLRRRLFSTISSLLFCGFLHPILCDSLSWSWHTLYLQIPTVYLCNSSYCIEHNTVLKFSKIRNWFLKRQCNFNTWVGLSLFPQSRCHREGRVLPRPTCTGPLPCRPHGRSRPTHTCPEARGMCKRGLASGRLSAGRQPQLDRPLLGPRLVRLLRLLSSLQPRRL